MKRKFKMLFNRRIQAVLSQQDIDALTKRGYKMPGYAPPDRCYAIYEDGSVFGPYDRQTIYEDGSVFGPYDRQTMREYACVSDAELSAALASDGVTIVPGYWTYPVRPLKSGIRIGCTLFRADDLRRVVAASDRMVRKSVRARKAVQVDIRGRSQVDIRGRGSSTITVETDGSVGISYSDHREDRRSIRAFVKRYL